MSFVIVGIYWVAHHVMFHHIKRSDRLMLWLNITFLMSIAFIPFPTALISRYGAVQTAVVVYAGHWQLRECCWNYFGGMRPGVTT